MATALLWTSPSSRLPRWLEWLALALILCLGARQRWQWPLVPLSDSDTWGYLHPALAKLTGHGFQHTWGRNFVYPGWVYLWLRGCGDFRAICLAQHGLGLATGVMLWRVWKRWLAWFPRPRLPGWLTSLAGLGLVSFYLSSTTAIFLEQRIRPEAIFPFFAILAIYLTLEFLRAWYKTRRTVAAAILGGAVVFDAILCYELKPSFGFAVGVAMLPLLVAILQPGLPWRRRLWPLGASAAALALAGLLLLWPEHELARTDDISTLFLPETLLTIHARIIAEQMARDLAAGNPTPYPTDQLRSLHERLDHELVLAAAPDQESYESLGFNPDYLMYQDSFCRFLYHQQGAAAVARLGFYYYERVWLHQPFAMARNVIRQLGIFYGWQCPAFWLGREINLTRNYRKTLQAFAPAPYFAEMLDYPPARAYLAHSRSLTDRPAFYRESPVFTRANRAAAELHLRLLLALAAGLALIVCLPFEAPRRELGSAGALSLLVFGYTFGNCLTVAVVHSLDLDRYSSNLLIFALLSEGMALVWGAEALLCAWFHFKPGLPDPLVSSPADAAAPS